MNPLVETYSGYKADERPLRFRLNGRKWEVVEVLDRWYGPEDSYFKVLVDDGDLYILRHRLDADQEQSWSIVSYRRGESGDAAALLPSVETVGGKSQ